MQNEQQKIVLAEKETPEYLGSDIAIWDFNQISGASQELQKRNLQHQMKLIQEEVKEANADLVVGDFEGFCKEMADVYVTVIGMMQKLENLGVDTAGVIKETAYNNLTKYPRNLSEAEASKQDYLSKGIEVNHTYNSFDNCYILRDKEGKVRKPTNYVKANVSQYVPEGVKL